jgi:hypothetical protein
MIWLWITLAVAAWGLLPLPLAVAVGRALRGPADLAQSPAQLVPGVRRTA